MSDDGVSGDSLIVVPGREKPDAAPQVLDATGRPVSREAPPPPKPRHCGWRVDGCGLEGCSCACAPCQSKVLAEGMLRSKAQSREVAARHFADKASLGRASARVLLRDYAKSMKPLDSGASGS